MLPALLALLIAALVALAAPVPTARAEEDPSWSDVQQAKKDARSKAAETRTIQGLLSGLEAKAARLEDASLQAEAARVRAASALAAADRTESALRRRTAAANRQAHTARVRAVTVTSQLYRSGDPTLAIWLAGRSSGSLLYRLGVLVRVGGTSAAMLRQATEDRRQAASLGAQAKVAAGIRDRLAARATTLADEAAAAERAADAQVAETKRRSATLLAQLKALDATYRRTKNEYQQAQAAKAAAAARNRAHADSAAPIGASSGSSGGGSLAPGAARAYAAGRMSAYGWGSRDNECLGWLWYRESGWRWNALNSSSGAYGIPQSLPGSKMASAGADWRTSASTQIDWGLGYIKDRYGSPCRAWSHETAYSWY